MTDDTIVARVRAVAEAFTISKLARLSIKQADFEIELRRLLPYEAPLPVAGVTPASQTSSVAALDEPAAQGIPVRKPDIVTSDLVGVLRFSRPHVNEGHHLEDDRELAFVEALGIRNPVRSRGPGRVAAVYVSDGQPVEYGQPLFAIER